MRATIRIALMSLTIAGTALLAQSTPNTDATIREITLGIANEFQIYLRAILRTGPKPPPVINADTRGSIEAMRAKYISYLDKIQGNQSLGAPSYKLGENNEALNEAIRCASCLMASDGNLVPFVGKIVSPPTDGLGLKELLKERLNAIGALLPLLDDEALAKDASFAVQRHFSFVIAIGVAYTEEARPKV